MHLFHISPPPLSKHSYWDKYFLILHSGPTLAGEEDTLAEEKDFDNFENSFMDWWWYKCHSDIWESIYPEQQLGTAGIF